MAKGLIKPLRCQWTKSPVNRLTCVALGRSSLLIGEAVSRNQQVPVLKWLSSFDASFQQLVDVFQLIVDDATDTCKAERTIDAVRGNDHLDSLERNGSKVGGKGAK